MSKRGSGAAAAAAARVSIPSSVRKMIENIKEITGNHSEEEIYAMLKECSMDPNEATQKLLFQDTFHEVRRKRDRKKENLNKETKEAKWKSGMHGRGNRVGRGSYPSRYFSNDTIGGRNSVSAKENGASQVADKGNSQEIKNKDPSNVSSLSTAVANGPPSAASGKRNDVQEGLASAVRGGVNQSERTGPGSGKMEGPLPVTPPAPPVGVVSGTAIASGTRDLHGRQMLETHNCSASITSAPSLGSSLSASDPVLLPSQDSRLPGAVGTIRREASQRSPSEDVLVKADETKIMSASEIVNTKSQGKMANKSQNTGKNQHLESSQTAISTHTGSSTSRPSSNYNNRSQVIGQQKGPSKEWKPKSSSSIIPQSSGIAASTEGPAASAEGNIQVLPVSGVPDSKEAAVELQKKLESAHISDRQHVIIPNHLHVPEAEKLGFCFGSFDASFGFTTTYGNGPEREKSSLVSETSEGNKESLRTQLLSQNGRATAEEGDHPQSSSHGPENLSPNEGEVPSSVVPDQNEAKQDALQGGHQDPVLHTSPNYSFGLMPPILGSQIAPFENSDSQARDVSRIPNFVIPQSIDPTSYYAQIYPSSADSDGRVSPFHSTGVATKYNGNVAVVPPQTSESSQEGSTPLVLSTAAPTPLVTQAAALMQSSLAVSQQPLPVFRQPPGMHLSHYPANYIPYGHYFSPLYIPPAAMHQFLSNGAFPQQPQAGSMYPPPSAATAKFSLPQYKPGNNAGNSTHGGATASYGSYGSSMANYNPGSAPTAGNQTSDDLAASQFKENNVYGTGQQTEGSGVWIAPPGRDISSLQASSLYGLPQGQVAFAPTQPGHGTFAGIYHPAHPVTAATVHPLLPQTMAGPVDMVGPAATVYQQPQHSQINWPSSY